MKGATRILKWVAGGLEALLGIPVLGGSIIIGLLWTPLIFMLAVHIVGLVLSVKSNSKKVGHILGIIASCVGFIPFVGMVLHILTAIFLLIEAAKNEEDVQPAKQVS